VPRRIVIEFPDNAGNRLYDDVFTQVSTVVRSVAATAGAAAPEVRAEAAANVVPVTKPPPPEFDRDLRGYDRREVDAWIAHVHQTPPPYARPTFTVALRGYRRHSVDEYVSRVTES
jgi:hypothetical protein